MTTTLIDTRSAAAFRTNGATSAWLIRLIERVMELRQRAQTKRDLRALSPELLRDVGIDAAYVSSGPVLHVDAGTMTSLMSMR